LTMVIVAPVSGNASALRVLEPAGTVTSTKDWLSGPLSRPIADLVATALSTGQWSDNTVRAYQTAIGLFLQFLDQERGALLPPGEAALWRPFAISRREKSEAGKRSIWHTTWEYRGPVAILSLVDEHSLACFRTWREREGDGANAVNTRVYAVQTFLRIALREHLLTDVQASSLKLKPYKARQTHDQQPAGRRLEPGEVARLRSVCDVSTVKGKRDLAVLDTILYAGLNGHEIASLRCDALRQEHGRTYIVVNGKGRQARRIKLHSALEASLEAWLLAAGIRLGERGFVFRSVNKGGRVARNGICTGVVLRLVTEYGCLAGIAAVDGPGRLTARDLRRTCARNAFDNGASLLLVQAMLGHNDPKTTVRYIGAFESEGDSAVDYVRY